MEGIKEEEITTTAFLIRDGVKLPIYVIATDDLSINQDFKTSVHKTIGSKDFYEYIGKGDEKISFKVYLKNRIKYEELVSFLAINKIFGVQIDKFGDSISQDSSSPIAAPKKIDLEKIYRLDGALKSSASFQDGSYLTEINLTSALNPDDDENFKFDVLKKGAEKKDSKKSTLDKIRNWASKTIDFVGNTNSKVSAFTGKFQEYATAINQLSNGIGSSSSIITSPISSVKNSVSTIVGGISSAISSITTAIEAIKQIPDDISNMIDSVLSLGDQLSNIFNQDNKAEQALTTTNFLIDIGKELAEVAQREPEIKVVNQDPYSVEFDAEIFIAAKDNSNSDVLSVMMLSSILLSIYEQAIKIQRTNTIDLNNIFKQTEALFSYIMSKELSIDVRSSLNVARNKFFEVFKTISDTAYKVIDLRLEQPRFLADVIYMVNGNLNFYDQTKKINNVIGSVVSGDIKIISG